jgi:hypothetical protein
MKERMITMKQSIKMLAMGAVFFAAGAVAGPRMFHAGAVHAGEGKPDNQTVVQTLDNQVGCPYYDQNGHHYRGGRRGGCWNGQPPCWQDDGNNGNQGQK